MLPKPFATALREGVEVLNGALAAEATGGVWTGGVPDFSSLSTDTREIKPGQWFLALKGQRFDAHDHVEQAVALGASALIVAKGVQPSCPQLVVPDTRVAL
ncbi:MAG: Mur ligase domain-containing protein, partial [Planctomycetota bacterium]|nr:Mur ligase domain-containing protein [Planctomycetota bacterium]